MEITSKKIVVAGCGRMGLPMAHRLLAAGYDVCGLDVLPAARFHDFSHKMVDGDQASATADILLSVVRDERQTLELCFDRQGVFDRSHYPHVLVICSTLSPRFLGQLRARLPDDVSLVDAPMSGAPVAAEEGRLSFMLGGPADTIDELEPMFETMGRRLFRAGGSGAGMTLKVLNNYVAAATVAAVRRTYAMATGLDVDIDQLREVMSASSGATWFGDNFNEISWSTEGYDRMNTIGILEKDVLSALDAVCDVDAMPESGFDDAVLDALRALPPFGKI